MRPSNRPKSHSLAPAHPATLTLASHPRDRLVASQRLTSVERLVESNSKESHSPNNKPCQNPARKTAAPGKKANPNSASTSIPLHLDLTYTIIHPILPTHRTLNNIVTSKRYSEYFDPCQEAANKSLKCLRRNGGDREMCQDYFE